MTDKTRTLTSALLAVPAILALLVALFLCTRGGGWLSFIFSCTFWSVAILIFLAAFRLYRVALFGFIGAAVVGAVAFVAGFFGPIIFTPESNQGPLLGIFVIGPLGTIVGTILGLLIGITPEKYRQQVTALCRRLRAGSPRPSPERRP